MLTRLSDSDEATKYGVFPQTKYPLVPGHEIVGDIAAVPSTEKKWKVGQRVGGGWHGGHCHSCHSCAVGDYMTCAEEDINGESFGQIRGSRAHACHRI